MEFMTEQDADFFMRRIEALAGRDMTAEFLARVEKWGMVYAVQHSATEIEAQIQREYAAFVIDTFNRLDETSGTRAERITQARDTVAIMIQRDLFNDRWSGTSTNPYANAVDAASRRAATNFFRSYLEA